MSDTFLIMVVSLGSTLALFASGPSFEFPVGFTTLGFSLKREHEEKDNLHDLETQQSVSHQRSSSQESSE